jgi:hypothetical protein
MLNLLLLLTAWTTEVVMTGDVYTMPGNIALDSLNNPYILISKKRADAPNGRALYYLFLYIKKNGSWSTDTIDLNSNEPNLFSQAYDLAIDKFNRIWVIYVIYREIDTTEHLIVAQKDTSGWVKDTVESPIPPSHGGYFFCQSIAIDTSGIPHIAYTNHVGLLTRGFYAYLDDTIWQKMMVDSLVTQFYCSIGLDSQNNPHISHFHYHIDSISQYEVLSHAYRIGNIWFDEKIDSAMNISHGMSSIAISPNNLLGISYADPTTGLIKYVYYDGVVWHIDTVDLSGGFDTQKSLDMDRLGKPCFIFAKNNYSWLAYKTMSGWQKESLPLTPMVTKGFGGSLRIDKDGIIHIARFATNDDYTYREIHYIYGTPIGIEENNEVDKNFQYSLNNFPNPLIEKTKIYYQLNRMAGNNQSDYISLKIYDITGRLVKILVNDHLQNGCYSVTWNKRDENNLTVHSGIYFCMLKTETFCKTIKLIVLR